MGTFTASVEIGDPGARRWEAVDVLVDSGATFTMLPRSLLEHLGVRPQDKVPFELADDRSIEYDVGETVVRIGNRIRTTLVVFGDNGLQPLLGAYTLEAFLLAVDTVNRRLVPVSGLLKRSAPKIRSLHVVVRRNDTALRDARSTGLGSRGCRKGCSPRGAAGSEVRLIVHTYEAHRSAAAGRSLTRIDAREEATCQEKCAGS